MIPTNIISIANHLMALWREILIVLLFGMLIYQNTSSVRYLLFIDTIPYLHDKVSTVTQSLNLCVDGNDILSQIIQDRNDEVKQWQSVSNKLTRENAQLTTKIVAMRKTTKKRVSVILNHDTPKDCKASIQYLRDSRQEITWPK